MHLIYDGKGGTEVIRPGELVITSDLVPLGFVFVLQLMIILCDVQSMIAIGFRPQLIHDGILGTELQVLCPPL